MINLPLYASPPYAPRGWFGAWAKYEGSGSYHHNGRGGAQKGFPSSSNPAPQWLTTKIPRQRDTQDWAEEGTVDTQRKIVRDGRLRWIMIEGGRERAPRTPSVLPGSGDDDFSLCLW